MALACGAEFVFLGRAAMYSVCALGSRGGDQVIQIVQTQLRHLMEQLGCEALAELPRRLA